MAIIDDVLAGVGDDSALVMEDRAVAIEWAIAHAAPEDTVLIAGKGHEASQEVAGRRLPFSDAEVAKAALLRRGRSSEGRR